MSNAKIEKRNDTGVSGIDVGDPVGNKRVKYHVMIDGVVSQIETLDSFAIKFGLLTNIPVTKIKHIIRKIPASMWSGTSKSKANGLLSLVEEAGGVGRIVLEEQAKKSSEPKSNQDDLSAKQNSCLKCGFPLGKDDDFCQFCSSRVGEGQEGKSKKSHSHSKSVKASIPPARLLFYLLVVFSAVIVAMVFKS